MRRRTITMEMPGDLSQLAAMASAVDDLLAENAVAPEVAFQVNLCIDELVTNAVRHGTATGGPPPRIAVRVTVGRKRGAAAGSGPGLVEVRVSDDGQEFNPLTAPPPDLDADLDHRLIGGLGLHLVRTVMDEVLYSRHGGRNVVTLRKHAPGAAAAGPGDTPAAAP